MEAEIKDIKEELVQIRMTLEMMKKFIIPQKDPEGELSDWAKTELAEARDSPESEFISHEEVRKQILENDL